MSDSLSQRKTDNSRSSRGKNIQACTQHRAGTSQPHSPGKTKYPHLFSGHACTDKNGPNPNRAPGVKAAIGEGGLLHVERQSNSNRCVRGGLGGLHLYC